jgi:hypothetical protein
MDVAFTRYSKNIHDIFYTCLFVFVQRIRIINIHIYNILQLSLSASNSYFESEEKCENKYAIVSIRSYVIWLHL